MASESEIPKDVTTGELSTELPPTDGSGFDRYAIVQWEWGEAEERWFEIVTGEYRDENEPRDPRL
jgi:hypothetical protein